MSIGSLALSGSALGADSRPDTTDSNAPGSRNSAPPSNSIYFVMLDAKLTEQRIELLSFRNGEVAFRDEAGRTQTVQLDDVAALLPMWWSPRGQTLDGAALLQPQGPGPKPTPFKDGTGVLELADGQRIGGGVVMSEDESSPTTSDEVLWETVIFGEVSVKMDAVRSIRFTPAPVVAATPSGTRLPQGFINLAAPPVVIPPPVKPASRIEAAPKAKADGIHMNNGDLLSGFIERIGPIVTIDADGRKVTTAVKQISEIRLLNQSRQPKGTRIWLGGGTVVDAARLTVDGPKPASARAENVRIELSPATWTRVQATKPAETPGTPTEAAGGKRPDPASKPGISAAQPPSAVLGIGRFLAVVPHVESLVSLASRPVITQRAAEGRTWFEPIHLSWFGIPWSDVVEPSQLNGGVRADGGSPFALRPPVDAADIELPGPMLAEWSIPASATRVAGWAELPRECWTWGHCTIVMTLAPINGRSTESIEVFRETLSSERPTAEFTIPIEPTGPATQDRLIRVEVLSGERGPIQDRVLLRRVLLLCKPGAGK